MIVVLFSAVILHSFNVDLNVAVMGFISIGILLILGLKLNESVMGVISTVMVYWYYGRFCSCFNDSFFSGN